MKKKLLLAVGWFALAIGTYAFMEVWARFGAH
jgi:hypothetical protein